MLPESVSILNLGGINRKQLFYKTASGWTSGAPSPVIVLGWGSALLYPASC